MLSNLFASLVSRLESLGIPVWLADCVPQDTALPYVTADIKPPLTPGGNGSLTLTLWHHSAVAHADRITQADQLLSLLPARGLLLTVSDGSVILRPDGPAVCVRENTLLGLRMTWTLQHFTTGQGGAS